MWPINTYLDMADNTYARCEDIDTRRTWGRIEVYDSNTCGKYYLCVKVSNNRPEHSSAHIRLRRGQVKQLIKALNKFVKES